MAALFTSCFVLFIVATVGFVLGWALPGFLGIRTALRKNYSPHWMWFGVWPGAAWITLIVLILLPARRLCASCREWVPAGTIQCRYCGARSIG